MMWNYFYKNKRLLILSIGFIIIWGLSAFAILPRMEDPEIEQRWALVSTEFPSASAYRVESLVTEKVEQKLLEVEEIKTLISSSIFGHSSVLIRLQPYVTDTNTAWSRVRDKLVDVEPELPPGASKPKYEDFLSRAYTLMVGLTWDWETPPNYAILSRFAKELRDQIRSIPGTRKVEITGQPQEEIIVEIEPTRLASLGITPQSLAQQIQRSDAKVVAGQLRSAEENILIETDTALNSLNRIRQIPIRIENITGHFATLGDVAKVERGIQEPPTELAIISGKPGIVVSALIESDRRTDSWSTTAKLTLERFRTTLPQGIGLQIVFDQSIYVKNRLNGLFKNLLLGTILVIVSTMFMMGWRSGLIVGTALPLSILMVFGFMQLLEVPLHQMSVTGLVIALGMLIDNAIVVVDELSVLLQQGMKPGQAITKGIKYLAIPLFASSMTSVFTFLPMILIPGDIGEFVSGVGRSVIIALLSSLILSLTIIPSLFGWITGGLSDSVKSERGFSPAFLTKLYQHFLLKILKRPILGIVLAFIVPVMGFGFAYSLDLQLFSPVDRDQFYIELEQSPQISINETKSQIFQAQAIIIQHSEVTDVHWVLGKSAPEVYYNTDRWRGNQPYYAQGIIQMKMNKGSQALIQTLQTELDQNFPNTRVLVRQLEQGDWFPSPVELRIYGSNLETLNELGQDARLLLSEIPGITHVRDSLSSFIPKFNLKIDEETARLSNLDNTSIAEKLNANLEGILGGSILEDTEEIPVRVRISEQARGELSQVANLDLVPDNINLQSEISSIPLSNVGNLELSPEIASISRRNGQRVNNIQGFIKAGILPSKVLNSFRESLESHDFHLPTGYSMEFGGEFESIIQAIKDLISFCPIIIMAMCGTLVLSFASFRAAGIIIVVAIGSIGLGLFSLWLFNYPLGFMPLLGIVGLVGVAINDSIVVLAALKSDPLCNKENYHAICKVTLRSTRHVLTTTITTIAGFVPLLLSGGEFWPPLVVCVAGGVGGATFLALVFVPCAYLLFMRSDISV